MCIVLWALGVHPVYEWIILSNRDEFYERPSHPMALWDFPKPLGEQPRILAGKDLKAEGTWLAIGENGRFAVLTNYRDFSLPHRGERTRGALPLKFIAHSHPNTPAFFNALTLEAQAYDPFNLLVGEGSEMHYFSRQTLHWQLVSPGIHGLSNAHLDTDWHKVKRGKYLLEKVLSEKVLPENAPPVIPSLADTDKPSDQGALVLALHQAALEILNDTVPAEDEDLPSTGLTLEQERMLSPIFIASPQYGTRFQTVLLKDYAGQMWILERYRLADDTWHEHRFDMPLK